MEQNRNIENCDSGRSVGVIALTGRPDCLGGGWVVEEIEIGAHRVRPAQIRKKRSDGWTKARKARFLTELAISCNVVRAAAKAGAFPSSAYRRRMADADFAAAWQEALQTGYDRLEAALLRRAIEVVESKPLAAEGGEDAELTADPNPIAVMTVAQAIDILKHKHAQLAGAKRAGERNFGARIRPTPEQTNAEIMRRIAIVRRQRAAVVPTKPDNEA